MRDGPVGGRQGDVRHVCLAFRRLLVPGGALVVCLLGLDAFSADAFGLHLLSSSAGTEALLARAEEPAHGFVVALGCLITFSAAAGLRRRRAIQLDEAQIEKLAAQARTDSLTGLGNHRAFEESLSATITARASTGRPSPCSRSTWTA
jgi:predicted signal transduction protein with EAL and GGDEF domain